MPNWALAHLVATQRPICIGESQWEKKRNFKLTYPARCSNTCREEVNESTTSTLNYSLVSRAILTQYFEYFCNVHVLLFLPFDRSNEHDTHVHSACIHAFNKENLTGFVRSFCILLHASQSSTSTIDCNTIHLCVTFSMGRIN